MTIAMAVRTALWASRDSRGVNQFDTAPPNAVSRSVQSVSELLRDGISRMPHRESIDACAKSSVLNPSPETKVQTCAQRWRRTACLRRLSKIWGYPGIDNDPLNVASNTRYFFNEAGQNTVSFRGRRIGFLVPPCRLHTTGGRSGSRRTGVRHLVAADRMADYAPHSYSIDGHLRSY
jgi:hypothetical protein